MFLPVDDLVDVETRKRDVSNKRLYIIVCAPCLTNA